MAIPDKPSYSHGSTGTEPGSAIDYANGDPFDSEHLDYYLNTEFSKIKALIDALNNIDSNDDGKVDAADNADQAANATNVKGNDIDSDGDGRVDIADSAREVNGADARHDYFSDQGYGTVPAGDFVPIGSFGLDDTETLSVTQATLTKDGLGTAAADGLTLVLVVEGATSPQATLINADGTTAYRDVEGQPIASYQNTSGSQQSVAVAINNGDLGQTGVGADADAYGGYIARIT